MNFGDLQRVITALDAARETALLGASPISMGHAMTNTGRIQTNVVSMIEWPR